MDWKSISYDWNQVRAFLVSAEEGSFSAAARAFGVSQPTLSRQVAALEEQLGVTLFERLGRTLSLTQPGLELLDHVRVMGEAANRLSLAASGKSQEIEGRVCITATDLVAQHLLGKALKRIRTEYPGIEIEVLACDDLSDLQRREADIAIRHTRPTQPDLIAQLVREEIVHLYAASDYLDKIGMPQSVEDLRTADFVGFDQSDELLTYLNSAGLPIKRDNFKIRSKNGTVAWELVKQGFGIGVMAKEIGDKTPGVKQLLPDFIPVEFPFWLVTHRELHTSRRIRVVFDILADTLKKPL